VWRIPFLYGASKRDKILETLYRYRVVTLDKQTLHRFDPRPVEYDTVYDFTTTSGTFICDGFVVHNCSDRLKAFIDAGVKDPLEYEVDIPWESLLNK